MVGGYTISEIFYRFRQFLLQQIYIPSMKTIGKKIPFSRLES